MQQPTRPSIAAGQSPEKPNRSCSNRQRPRTMGEPTADRLRRIGVTHDRYGRAMPTNRRRAMAGFLLFATVSLAGCGGSTVVESCQVVDDAIGLGESTPDHEPASATVVVRTGGIAGVRDMVRIAADGTARLTSKTGTTRACTPSQASLDRLRGDRPGGGEGDPVEVVADGRRVHLLGERRRHQRHGKRRGRRQPPRRARRRGGCCDRLLPGYAVVTEKSSTKKLVASDESSAPTTFNVTVLPTYAERFSVFCT